MGSFVVYYVIFAIAAVVSFVINLFMIFGTGLAGWNTTDVICTGKAKEECQKNMTSTEWGRNYMLKQAMKK